MITFNTQIAELVNDQELCQKVYQGFNLGQSVRHIGKKYDISDYAVRKIVKFWLEMKNRTSEVR